MSAKFEVEATSDNVDDGLYDVVFDSAGGVKAGEKSRNRDYPKALALLAQRLSSLEARLLDVVVDSTKTRHLPLDERRVVPADRLPLDLKSLQGDPDALYLLLTRGQGWIGSGKSAASGNSNRRKRLRISIKVPLAHRSALIETLVRSPVQDRPAQEVISDKKPYRTGSSTDTAPSVREAGGQGYGRDEKVIKAVEMRAVEVATAYYEIRGWNVKDVGATSSWDLTCRKEGAEKHVEVKGTRGSLGKVILTANEVKHAQDYSDIALFVVHGITTRWIADDEVIGEGGEQRLLDPWEYQTERATPTQFSYDLLGH